jgi:hypothetical protein
MTIADSSDLIEPVPDRKERHVERVELLAWFQPAPMPSSQRPPETWVDAGRRLHEHADVPVADAEDEATDPDAARRRGGGRHRVIPSRQGFAGSVRSETE